MKKTIFTLLIILFYQCTYAQILNIPDLLFKNAILNENPGVDLNSDWQIQISEANAYTGCLDVSGYNITDLTGIEEFINIDTLNCYFNQLSSINLSNNINLIRLNCSHNSLNSLDISNNTLLVELNCQSNYITALNVDNNLNLIELWCANNQISILNLDNNIALELINCPQNQIAGLNVSNNTNLTTLLCNTNLLTSLNVDNNILLSQLTCNNNDLGTLNVSNNINLVDLHCGNTDITSLDVSNNLALVELECTNNALGVIILSNNTLLEKLVCFNIQISSINLSNNTNLNYLNCGYNNLTELDVSNNPLLYYLAVSGNNIQSLNVMNNSLLTTFWCNDNNLNYLNLKNGNNYIISNLKTTNNPNLQCIEVDDPVWAYIHFPNIDQNTTFGTHCLYGIADPDTISGTVYIDTNCTIDGDEHKFIGMIVKTGPDDFYGITDSLGYYKIYTDTGTYQVEQVIPDNSLILLNTLCPVTNYHTVVFDSLGIDTTGLDFHNEGIACPYLTIDINSDRRRRCFRNNTYVQYCNEGYADATNVQVFVQMPEYVQFLSADSPYNIDSVGNYIFDINDLVQGECGTIHIIDSVDCILGITGFTQCSKAWIIPPNDCVDQIDTNAYNLWDHSSIMVDGECLGDSLVCFKIFNTGNFGSGDMLVPSEYRIYADNRLCLTEYFQLSGQDSLVIELMANGQTIRLEADQHPMHPGNSHPNATIELCGDTTGISLGLINNLPMDDQDVNVEIDCRMIIDSYDPNEKNVSPTGFTSNNYILPSTQLEYVIQFQNTGTDTAYNVIVVDTISTYLDIFSIDWGVSSHPYIIDVYGHGQLVVKFTFNDICLPDSSTNELMSKGFVKFKISPLDSLPNGTEIHNHVDIYFDYNIPITTEDAWVTVYDTVLTGSQVIFYNKEEYHLDSATICLGDSILWDGNYYCLSGLYNNTYNNIYGCDSVLSLNLAVNFVDVSVTENGISLIANTIGASYQWIDCNNGNVPISGEINQTFTATEDGVYAVIINDGTCVDTSDCYTITGVNVCGGSEILNISVFPNPSKGIFTINGTDILKIEIIDESGRRIRYFNMNEVNENRFDITDLKSGIYVIKIITNSNTEFRKIIIE
ncbi:MAG: T9SS type A sorting domain-containing protein [Bacteroidota bacterium]